MVSRRTIHACIPIGKEFLAEQDYTDTSGFRNNVLNL